MKPTDKIKPVPFHWRLPSWLALSPEERLEIPDAVTYRHAKGVWPKSVGLVKKARFEAAYQACWEVDH